MATGAPDELGTEPPLSTARLSPGRPGLERFAWFLLAYLVAVILFGAWVRITGSGAGCGSHWPTCHGEIIPRSPAAGTLIEYTHRVTSAVLGVMVLGLVAWAFVGKSRARVRAAATVTLLFTVIEALIGARIVLAELVADNASIARATVVAIHLVSTFTLTAAAGLTAWWSREARALPLSFARAPRAKWALVAAVVAIITVSMTGAVTALGDTLFPVPPTEDGALLSRLRADLSPAAHFLVRLRIVHPVLAVLVGALLVALPAYIDETAVGVKATALLRAIRWAALVQLALGVANIWLGAPGWMQLVHLLMAQALWLLVVFAAVETLGTGTATGSRALSAAP